MTTIKYFIDHRGQSPVTDFLDKNIQIKNKASIIINNIKTYGLISVIPNIKRLTKLPLWEIRIMGKNSSRILFATKKDDLVILLHAFKKKSMKTPPKEIKIALKRLNQLP